MTNKIIPVEREGGGKILTPGTDHVANPLLELRMDLEKLKRNHELEAVQLRHDMKCQYDVLESHIQDVERVSKAALRDMIKCINKIEKLVVETGFKA